MGVYNVTSFFHSEEGGGFACIPKHYIIQFNIL